MDQEVFGELFTRTWFMRPCLVEKDEGCSGLSDDPFDEFDAEACQSISVGHHNFFDQAALDMSQKPREPLTLIIESGPDILVDLDINA